MNESLAAPPVRHHGPGTADAGMRVLATPTYQPVHQPSSRKSEGYELGPPQAAALAQVRDLLYRKVLRSTGRRRHRPMVARVLHHRRGNTFRFVVCRNSIQGAMALQLSVSNHRWQPSGDGSFDRKAARPRRAVAKAELDQGGVSRHDARPAGASFST